MRGTRWITKRAKRKLLCYGLALACFSLCWACGLGSTSASALSDSQILSPTKLDFKWQNNTGNQGTHGVKFKNYEASAASGAASRWVDMTWSGGDMANLHLYNNYNVQFSFAIDVRLRGTASNAVQFPNFITPGWRNSSNVCAVMDNIEMDVIPITMSSIGYTATINIRGQLWADNSDNALCFYGPFFHNLGAQSWDVKISQPSLSINPNWQYDTLTGMNTLIGAIRNNTDTMKNTLNQLKQNGITAKVDNSEVVQEINKGNEAQKNRWEQEDQKATEASESEVNTNVDAAGSTANENLNIFKAILETPTGSCKLSNIGAFGFNLGELDLCANKPPEWLRTVLAAVVTITMASGAIKAIQRILWMIGEDVA